jgi:hypothetical protein
MRTFLLGCLASLLLLCTLAYAATWIDQQWWGLSGQTLLREWVSPSGRLSLQSQVSNGTALDLWSPANPTPTDSRAEVTLHRFPPTTQNDERISLSAMPDVPEGYRVSIEAIGNGASFQPITFCFDNWAPNYGYCVFQIGPSGVYVRDQPYGNWRKL